MSDERSFIQLAIDGYVMLDEIDDYVDQWHEKAPPLELHDFLGLTWQEYSLWVAHPDNLSIVIAARREHQPVLEAVNDNLRSAQRLAARTNDVSRIAALERWIAAQPDR